MKNAHSFQHFVSVLSSVDHALLLDSLRFSLRMENLLAGFSNEGDSGGAIMRENYGRVTTENLSLYFVRTFGDSVSNVSSHTIFVIRGETHSIRSTSRRIFGREKSVHHLLGGGKSADVLLWRDMKTSSSSITCATVVWLLFEWLNYHLLTLCCLGLSVSMLSLFLWANFATYVTRSPPRIPRFALSEDLLVNAARALTFQINRVLDFLHRIALGKDLKTFLTVIASLWVLAMLGSWCNLPTLVYIGFVAAHTLPALYERYEDQVDPFVLSLLDELKGKHE